MKTLLPLALVAGLVAWRTQDPVVTTPAASPWEYRVVGLTEMHESTLGYLKGIVAEEGADPAAEEDEGGVSGALGGLLKLGRRVDDQLVARTQDLLNELGQEGWELVEYRQNVLVLKRPLR